MTQIVVETAYLWWLLGLDIHRFKNVNSSNGSHNFKKYKLSDVETDMLLRDLKSKNHDDSIFNESYPETLELQTSLIDRLLFAELKIDQSQEVV